MTEKKTKGVSDAGAMRFDADVAKPAKPPGGALKVRRIGNSLGVVLPKELLAKLRVGEGDLLSVSETPDGVVLRAFDDRVARQVEIARDLARRYRNTLRELAK
jgi:putative addiction module antidote